MKTKMLLFSLILSMLSLGTQAQNEKTYYARTFANKVEAVNNAAYIKLIKEQIKPALQLAKQNGTIVNWSLYSVGFTGASSEYNYISVFIFDSWEKTETTPDLEELVKKVNPKADGAAVVQQLNTLRKVAKQEMYQLLESVNGSSTTSPKYLMVDYMKPKDGQAEAYLAEEKEVWKPIHQELVKSGQTEGWDLWSLVFPSASNLPYDYVTVNLFKDYSKLNLLSYSETVKKVYPNRTAASLFGQTSNTRTMAKSELWKLVETLQP